LVCGKSPRAHVSRVAYAADPDVDFTCLYNALDIPSMAGL